MKIFQALYSDCIYEGGFRTLSIHYTVEGAENAIAEHKKVQEAEYTEWNKDLIEKYPEEPTLLYKVQDWQVWYIEEIEVLP